MAVSFQYLQNVTQTVLDFLEEKSPSVADQLTTELKRSTVEEKQVYEEKAKELEDEISTLQTQKSDLITKLSDIETQRETYKTLAETKSEVEREKILMKQLDDKNQELMELKSQLLVEKSKELAERAQLLAQLEQKNKEVIECEQKFETSSGLWDTAIQEKQAEISRMTETFEKMNAESKREIESSTRALQDLHNTNETNRRNFESLEKSNKDLQTKIREIENVKIQEKKKFGEEIDKIQKEKIEEKQKFDRLEAVYNECIAAKKGAGEGDSALEIKLKGCLKSLTAEENKNKELNIKVKNYESKAKKYDDLQTSLYLLINPSIIHPSSPPELTAKEIESVIEYYKGCRELGPKCLEYLLDVWEAVITKVKPLKPTISGDQQRCFSLFMPELAVRSQELVLKSQDFVKINELKPLILSRYLRFYAEVGVIRRRLDELARMNDNLFVDGEILYRLFVLCRVDTPNFAGASKTPTDSLSQTPEAKEKYLKDLEKVLTKNLLYITENEEKLQTFLVQERKETKLDKKVVYQNLADLLESLNTEVLKCGERVVSFWDVFNLFQLASDLLSLENAIRDALEATSNAEYQTLINKQGSCPDKFVFFLLNLQKLPLKPEVVAELCREVFDLVVGFRSNQADLFRVYSNTSLLVYQLQKYLDCRQLTGILSFETRESLENYHQLIKSGGELTLPVA